MSLKNAVNGMKDGGGFGDLLKFLTGHQVDLNHIVSVITTVIGTAAVDIQLLRNKEGDARISEIVDLVWPHLERFLPADRTQAVEDAVKEIAIGVVHLTVALHPPDDNGDARDTQPTLLGTNVDPRTGMRQDVVSDQDLKNGLSGVLQFVAGAMRMNPRQGADYLDQVARDVASGKGHPAPVPGPVTPKS